MPASGRARRRTGGALNPGAQALRVRDAGSGRKCPIRSYCRTGMALATLTGGISAMRLLRKVLAFATGMAAPLPHPVVRRSAAHVAAAHRSPRRGIRCAIAALVLGLGLNGAAPCVCAPQLGRENPESPSCCPTSNGSRTDTSLKASSSTCCASEMTAADVAARIHERTPLRHTPAAAAVTPVPPGAPLAPSMTGAPGLSPRTISPPRLIVLRI